PWWGPAAGIGAVGAVRLPPDVRGCGGAQDGAGGALVEHAVGGQRPDDVTHVPDERPVGAVLTVLGDEVVDRAAVTDVGVLHARVDPADDDGGTGVGALAGLTRSGVFLHDGEGDGAVGGVAGVFGGRVVQAVVAGLRDGGGAVVGRRVVDGEVVLDGVDPGDDVGGRAAVGDCADVAARLVLAPVDGGAGLGRRGGGAGSGVFLHDGEG